MSFLGDLVNSIGTDKVPSAPSRPIQRPVPKPAITSSAAHTKPIPKASLQASSAPSLPPSNTLKRKADERDGRNTEKAVKPLPDPIQTSNVKSRPSTPIANGSRQAAPKQAAAATTPTSATASKAPPKGSFADIMARAKQAQEQRTTSQVGMIKHQATNREKVSKLAERRRQEQEKLKSDKTKPSSKPSGPDRGGKRRSTSPQKKTEPVKAPRAPRPPLHAPQSGYKGTMGMASKRTTVVAAGRPSKKSKYDDYLGTDEEEDSEMEDYDDEEDGAGYGSDGSSDMEGGFDEIESEEAAALRVARQDDAKELAFESQLKRQKEERRRKLAQLAKKSR